MAAAGFDDGSLKVFLTHCTRKFPVNSMFAIACKSLNVHVTGDPPISFNPHSAWNVMLFTELESYIQRPSNDSLTTDHRKCFFKAYFTVCRLPMRAIAS